MVKCGAATLNVPGCPDRRWVVNPELPETDAETWAAPINVGGDRKIAGNKQDPAPPASPCPWVEDGECDEDANGLGICAPNTDEQDCIFG